MSTWNPSPDQVTGSLRQGRQPDGDPLADIPIRADWEPCPEMVIGSLRKGTHAIEALFAGLGTGRTIDAHWPPPVWFQDSTGAVGTDAFVRQGWIGSFGTNASQSPGGTVGTTWRGRACYKLTAGSGIQECAFGLFDFHNVVGGGPRKGDRACWRVTGFFAAEPSGAGDAGLSIRLEGSASSVGQTGGGILLKPLANNTVALKIRPTEGGSLTVDEVCPIDLDVGDFNFYDVRFLGATDSEEATLKVLINGQTQFRLKWDDEGALPTDVMTVVIGSRGGGVIYLPPMGGGLMAAPIEGLLL